MLDIDNAKMEFRRLVVESFASKDILKFLLRMHEEADLSPEDMGWVLWNICDWYAMAHDPITQQKYQSDFFNLVKCNFPERAHWVVCDGTQANEQIRGGFLKFWWGCYQFANDNAPPKVENRIARFQAHRANAGSYMKFGEELCAKSALEAMACLLQEDLQWPSQRFASVTYKTLMLEFYAATGQTAKVEEMGESLERNLGDWLQRIGDAQIVWLKDMPLFGSWDSFITDWPPANGLSVGFNNAACVFARIGLFSVAERLFRTWMDYQRRVLNDYGQALFIQSCWHNRHSRDEVIHMLSEAKSILAEYLIEIAPEMADVVKDARL